MCVTQALPQSRWHRCQLLLLAGAIGVVLLTAGCASRTVLGEKLSDTSGSPAVNPDAGAQTTAVSPLQKFLRIFSPYHATIQQGNFISQEMLSQLKVGMTRDQVRFVLGTPLLTDIFHAERWDYPFRLAKGDGEVISSRVVVFFKEGKVARFEGGNLPTEKEYIARIAGPAPASALIATAPAPEVKPAATPATAAPDGAAPKK